MSHSSPQWVPSSPAKQKQIVTDSDAPSTPCRTPAELLSNPAISIGFNSHQSAQAPNPHPFAEKLTACPPTSRAASKPKLNALNVKHHHHSANIAPPIQEKYDSERGDAEDTPPIAFLREIQSRSRSVSPVAVERESEILSASPPPVRAPDIAHKAPDASSRSTDLRAFFGKGARGASRGVRVNGTAGPSAPLANPDRDSRSTAPLPRRAITSASNGTAGTSTPPLPNRVSSASTSAASDASQPAGRLSSFFTRRERTPGMALPVTRMPDADASMDAPARSMPLAKRLRDAEGETDAASSREATPHAARRRRTPRGDAARREATPHAAYTLDSLIRRRGRSAARGARDGGGGGGARDGSRGGGGAGRGRKKRTATEAELEEVGDADVASLGELGHVPMLGMVDVEAVLRGMREGVDADGAGGGGEWWMRPRENTAPAQRYVALLEETFGAGSVLRGETKPPSRKSARQNGHGSGASAVSSSATETDEEDVMEDANADLKKRAQSWISEIQTVVKGKKTMERTDMKALANILLDIKEDIVDADEASALGDDGELLRQSLRQLEQAEHIPFSEVYPVLTRARKLVEIWPEGH
ncbi:hypothetical protein C8J57DRAFT_1462500 [Mycena rebaudengoi]|nr:hypothetical protein C8J57DRAFT_1462500 [Mycena rebaudengoi]